MEPLDAALAQVGLANVSRETRERLKAFVGLLDEWQRVQSLVSRKGDDDVWVRHVADSAQLIALAPGVHRWLDLGSGGGFPGMVLAILLAETPGAAVHLVESNQRKVAFLRAAKRLTNASAIVHAGRIEDITVDWTLPVDAVSARALASFDTLCAWIAPLLRDGRRAYLHKGADFAAERAEASLRWTLDLVEHPSRIGSGVIVEVRAIVPRQERQA